MGETVKLKLNEKQKKKFFVLPIEQSVTVPSTKDKSKPISPSEHKRRVTNVRKFFSKKFGGDTSIKASGGFVLKNGKLVKEKVVKVTSFSDKRTFNRNRNAVLGRVGKWAKKWGQESVAYEHEGDLVLIPPSRKRRISPTRKKVLIRNLRKARLVKLRKR